MRTFASCLFALVVVGCASASTEDGASSADLSTDRHGHHDAGASSDGGSTTDGGSTDDGTPTRNACTSSFGSGLSGMSGRLDGTIVSVIPTGTSRQCNGDSTHVHVQVLSQGSVYDVAVNADGGFIAEKDVPLPGGAFREGWHGGMTLSYTGDLGLHSGDFQTGSLSDITQDIENALANANHVSVFGTLYNHGGLHLIHRSKSNGVDGALITEPLSANARVFAFHFASQTF